MKTADLNIDRIVREVVARLQESLRAPSIDSQRTAVAPPAGELRVVSPVVSLATLEGRLNGVRQLVVARGAVVTPAVHDLLHEKDISLSYANAKATGHSTIYNLAVVALKQRQPWVAKAERTLGTRAHEFSCSESFVKATRDELRQKEIIALSDEPERVVCLANRSDHVLAIVAHDEQQLSAALASVRPNLVAVRPGANTSLEPLLRQLLANDVTQAEVS